MYPMAVSLLILNLKTLPKVWKFNAGLNFKNFRKQTRQQAEKLLSFSIAGIRAGCKYSWTTFGESSIW